MARGFDPQLLPAAPDLSFESRLWQQGVEAVAGLDEAGRGAWAGPVFAAAVILPCDPGIETRLAGVNDSKKLTATTRARLAERIKNQAAAWSTGSASASEIDAVGILPATRLAMQRAVNSLALPAQALLIDYVSLPAIKLSQASLVKGDARSLSIAAASILAKTTRDAFMETCEQDYPGYGFALHKGYGTRRHLAALRLLGCCGVHRLSFKPVAAEQISFTK